jgi:hypothetical protein
MPFDLNAFRNRFIGGGAKHHSSKCESRGHSRLPAGLGGRSRFAVPVQLHPFPRRRSARSSQLLRAQAEVRRVTVNSTRFDITVLNDEDFKIRKAFEAWMEAMAGHSTTTSIFNGGLTVRQLRDDC